MNVLPATRELRLVVAYNVRHIGGYPTADGRTTSDSIFRAASLHRLTNAGVEALAAAGVEVVVDLRSRVERERDVTPDLAVVGIRRVNAPVFEQDASPVGLEHGFPGYAAVYRSMLESGRAAYRSLFETIAGSGGGLLFHCAAGKDRTGVAAALLLGLAGVDDATITADYAISSALLGPVLETWLPAMRERGITDEQATQLLASPAEDMVATLHHLRVAYDDAEGYLRTIGIDDRGIRAIRERMTATDGLAGIKQR